MAVTEHRPNARDSTGRWQTYADLLEAEIERLRKAIRTHKELISDDGLPPSSAPQTDKDLWSTLDA